MEKLNNKKEVIVYSVNRYFSEDLSINIQNGAVVINAPWFFTNSKIRKIIEDCQMEFIGQGVIDILQNTTMKI